MKCTVVDVYYFVQLLTVKLYKAYKRSYNNVWSVP